MEEIKINEKETLSLDFSKLTGKDFLNAEKLARMKGDQTAQVAVSATFQAIIAAKAGKVSYEKIEKLSLDKFSEVVSTVAAFLLK